MGLFAELPGEGATFGRYRLLEPIGAGGMAVVYRAACAGPDGTPRTVVIKRVLPELSRDPAFAKMLVAEARLSARLRHRAIVEVFEFGRVGDEYYLAMEHVDGVDLVRLLNRCLEVKRPLPVGLACYIVCEVAAALAYAHELSDDTGRPLSVIHRDVSPSNVMVTSDGRVKLLDFGVAKAAEHLSDDRTRTGTLKGKVHYLSPEQADGMPIDRRSDQFALGIVMHECLAMRRLFVGDGDLATLRLVREAKVEPPSKYRAEVDPEADRVALKLLSRDPAARYPSCHELSVELEPLARALGGGPTALAEFISDLGPIDRSVKKLRTGSHRSSPAGLDADPTPRAQHVAIDDAYDDLSVERGSPWRWRPLLRRVRELPLRARLAMAGGALAVALVALVTGQSLRNSPAHHSRGAGEAAGEAPGGLAANSSRPSAAPAPPVAPLPKPGVLVVDVDVSNARIELDGRVVALAAHGARVSVDGEGEHWLAVSAPRRKPFRRPVRVPAGTSLPISISLERSHATDRKRPPRGENYLVDPFGGRP